MLILVFWRLANRGYSCLRRLYFSVNWINIYNTIRFGRYPLVTFHCFLPIVAAFGALGNCVFGLILGVICLIGVRSVGHLGWAIVLLMLGILGGCNCRHIVVLGALIGLISRLTHE